MIEINNKTRSRPDIALARRLAERFLEERKLGKQEVSIVFVGDKLMRSLNKQYRGKDRPTDILAFREKESSNPRSGFLGEILLDFQQIKRQAKSLKKSVKKELSFILVHGLLHLLGYDHQNEKDKQKMDKLTEEFLIKSL